MIKNLVFDLGGVIVPLNRMACLRAFDEILGYKDFGEILSSYRQGGYFEQFENGKISSRRFRQTIRSHASKMKDGRKRVVTDREIDYSLNRFLGDIPQDRIETLVFYKNDYRVFMLSNTNSIGFARCRELFKDKGYEVEYFFEKLFLSYKMGVAKPSPDIFHKMIKIAKILPEETLFIDDAPANIETANSLGFKTLFYNPKDDLYAKVSESLERE